MIKGKEKIDFAICRSWRRISCTLIGLLEVRGKLKLDPFYSYCQDLQTAGQFATKISFAKHQKNLNHSLYQQAKQLQKRLIFCPHSLSRFYQKNSLSAQLILLSSMSQANLQLHLGTPRRLHSQHKSDPQDLHHKTTDIHSASTISSQTELPSTPAHSPPDSPVSLCYQGSSEDSARFAVTDRFIPSRKLLKRDSLFRDERMDEQENKSTKMEGGSANVGELYRRLLMAEGSRQGKEKFIESFENSNILRYTSKTSTPSFDTPQLSQNSNLEFTEQLSNLTTRRRKINKLPCKVLDAPALQDDFYLNLIDWSTQNYLAVGLASSVYLWNAANSKVSKLCDLGQSNCATSVSWSLKGPELALGTNSGEVQLWDINKMKRARTLQGHTNRVGAIAWNSSIVSTGSRDKNILHRDLRVNAAFVSKLVGHKQEICGLKWSYDEQQLCSGGNDNKLLVWNAHSCQPILKYNDHVAAVKAMTWSPHQHGLLVSGGGTADRTIRFRNTLTGTTLKTIDAGSQICNLMFSKSLNEIVSTHGYSHNEINIWKYPRMEKIATLTGHTYRVLYLAMSPDGSTIVTGAGDQTLRFWNVFPGKNQAGKRMGGLLNTETCSIR